MTEQKNNDDVTITCTVSTYEPCPQTHRVKWLLRGQNVDKNNKDVRTLQSVCSVSVHFKTSIIYTSEKKFLQCEVMDGDNMQLFPFIPEKPDENMMIYSKSN